MRSKTLRKEKPGSESVSEAGFPSFKDACQQLEKERISHLITSDPTRKRLYTFYRHIRKEFGRRIIEKNGEMVASQVAETFKVIPGNEPDIFVLLLALIGAIRTLMFRKDDQEECRLYSSWSPEEDILEGGDYPPDIVRRPRGYDGKHWLYFGPSNKSQGEVEVNSQFPSLSEVMIAIEQDGFGFGYEDLESFITEVYTSILSFYWYFRLMPDFGAVQESLNLRFNRDPACYSCAWYIWQKMVALQQQIAAEMGKVS
jgi:hypothetical protein